MIRRFVAFLLLYIPFRTEDSLIFLDLGRDDPLLHSFPSHSIRIPIFISLYLLNLEHNRLDISLLCTFGY